MVTGVDTAATFPPEIGADGPGSYPSGGKSWRRGRCRLFLRLVAPLDRAVAIVGKIVFETKRLRGNLDGARSLPLLVAIGELATMATMTTSSGSPDSASVQFSNIWFTPDEKGLSHLSFYDTRGERVPGPSALVLVGLALTVLALAHRRFSG